VVFIRGVSGIFEKGNAVIFSRQKDGLLGSSGNQCWFVEAGGATLYPKKF
jgi:hypothetical protein